MNDKLMRSWWLLALRGALLVTFGVLALAWPESTLIVLVALFAAYAFFGGVVWIAAGVSRRWPRWPRWLMLAIGALSCAAGAVAVAYPAITLLVLVTLMGAHAIVSGVFDIAAAIRLRKLIHNEWLLVLSGIVSLVFGALVLLYPVAAGLAALVLLVSVYAILAGLLLLAAAWRVRNWSRLHGGRSSPAAGAA